MFSAHITSSTAAHSPFSSEVPSSAQTRVNKACDGMSAREVWSGAGSRATALYGAARLRHSLPSCQNSPAEDSPAFPPPLLPSSSSSSTSSLPALGSICCAGTAFFFFVVFFVVFRHLVRGLHRRQMSPNCPPPFLEKKKKKQETTAKDNPRLKTNLKLKIVYFSPPKVYKYFSITCRHFRLTLIPR